MKSYPVSTRKEKGPERQESGRSDGQLTGLAVFWIVARRSRFTAARLERRRNVPI
jgi:hypothetical protein